MKKNGILLRFLASVFVLASITSAAQTVYKGKLSPTVVPGRPRIFWLNAASAETTAKLPVAPGDGDQVLTTKLLPNLQAVVVVPQRGDNYMYFDLNQDGKFEGAERFVLPAKDDISLTLKLPMTTGIYQSGIPMQLKLMQTKPPEPRKYLTATFRVTASGTVDIDGRPIMVEYNFDLRTKSINPRLERIAVDCNGDGKFAVYPNNVEVAIAKGSPVVFRVGNHYVITKSADVTTGEIVMEERPASEYIRIEMQVGSVVPDFPFRDFDGKPHQLAEFRGKYLLIDFWGTW